MLTLSDRPTTETRTKPAETIRRTLAAGEMLFREGEPRRHVYRVEKGAVCVFKQHADGTRNILEFAFPGDLVGLGYLDQHVSHAQATMESSLTCLPHTAAEATLDKTPANTARLATAMEREVAFLRETRQRSMLDKPLGRIAALLITLGRYNAYEGRDPTVITDALSCGVIADYLGMNVDDLAEALAELARRGLVEASDKGLQLKSLYALERLAETAD